MVNKTVKGNNVMVALLYTSQIILLSSFKFKAMFYFGLSVQDLSPQYSTGLVCKRSLRFRKAEEAFY